MLVLPEMSPGLAMLEDLPEISPARAAVEIDKVKKVVQRIDLKRFIFNSPGNLTVYWGLFARAGLATFADVKSRSSELFDCLVSFLYLKVRATRVVCAWEALSN